MCYSIIRVIRNEKGECVNCSVDRTFYDVDEAELYKSKLNMNCSDNNVRFVMDSYEA